MVSQGTDKNSIIFLENDWPLARASQTGRLTFDEDGSQLSIWDYLECTGIKSALDLDTSPEERSNGWAIVVVNSLDAPLVLEKVALWSGDQIGYAAIMYDNRVVEGTQDTIPGIRDHPLKPGVKLHPVGVWTFESAPAEAFELAMRFSSKKSSGEDGKAIGVAVRLGAYWNSPFSAQTADVDQFKTPSTDTPEKILRAFYDQRTDSQGSNYEIGTETTVWASMETGISPRESAVNQHCLVVWIRPSNT